MKLRIIFCLLATSLCSASAMAGVYEATVERANQYYSSSEYAQKAQTANVAEGRQYNSQAIRNAYLYANRFHRGLSRPIEISYGSSGWVKNIEISCRDGNDCKCAQYGKLSCECVNRVTFEKHTDMDDDWYLRAGKKHH